MTGISLADLVVEVLHDQGGEDDPDWSTGSGYVVAPHTVLTAAHNVGPAGTLLVRVRDVEYPATVALLGDDVVDVAVLTVPGLLPEAAPPPCGKVNRHRAALIRDCWAVGFPRFKERRKRQLTAQANGDIATGENLAADLLTLRVTATPRALAAGSDGSEWSGMSGAAVFSGTILIGVVTEHHRPEGGQALGVVPLTALDGRADADRWWSALGVARDDFVDLPHAPPSDEYLRERVAELGADELLDREDELAFLAAFSTGREPLAWLVGGPWAGKTSLTAHFLRTPPENVDCLAFFLSRRMGDADASAFLHAVSTQLTALLGVTADRLGTHQVFRSLWRQAVGRARRLGRHLLLVVDGLDEDLGPQRGQPSVASLLPGETGERVHLLVTSRPLPELPVDVIDHPLTSMRKTPLKPSRHALELARRAAYDLDDLLGPRDPDPAREALLAALVAAEGPIAADDLPTVLRESGLDVGRPRILRLLDQDVARLLERTTGTEPRYVFAHESLRESAESALGETEVNRLRGCVHAWAERFRAERWPYRTPRYLLDGYPGMVAAGAPERLISLYGDAGYVGRAVAALGVHRVGQELRRAEAACPAEPLFARLGQALYRESHRFGSREGDTQLDVVRALRLQALESGDGGLAERADQWLSEEPAPLVMPVWTADRVPSALTRTLLGHAKPIERVAIDRARHNGPVLFLAVDAHRQMITSGGADCTVRTWDLRNGCPWGISGGPTGLVEVIGDSLSVLHEVPGYSQWSRRDRRLRRTADRWDATPRPPTAMAVNQRGTRVITGSGDWHVRAWDLKHGRRLPLRDEMSRHTSPIRAVALTPRGDRAATIDASGHLKLWLVRRGLPYSEQSFPANATVAISGDMSHVIALKDDVVHVWPVTTDTTRAHRVSAGVEAGRAVAISGDGRVALADSGDRELLVWDVRAGRLRCRADGLLGPVESIVTDATGSYAATMSAEGIVQIWRPAEGTCLLTFAAPRPVTAWALASGGSLPGVALVLGGDGGALSAFQIVP
ncbi:trypsin-like peptidase domain-containing protein [Nonomuraea sp. NPDC046570]|uniref:trypsin-like peptidase domain-containing protein n=1 Tax=Nonomuraea sp. NPDC046570 TaxID=3155255 RepID=UPI0033D2229A